MAVVVSLAAFSAYAYALAALLGVLVAGERFSAAQLAGGVVVLLAVVVVIAAQRPRKRQGELATSAV